MEKWKIISMFRMDIDLSLIISLHKHVVVLFHCPPPPGPPRAKQGGGGKLPRDIQMSKSDLVHRHINI